MAGPTSVTVGGINANIYCDGYRKGIDPETGPWREVIYILPWGDSDDFMDALRGINTPVVSGGSIIYPLPHQYPGNAILFCMEVWAEPVGTPQPDAKLFAADYALVHATYRVPRVDIPGTDNANAFGNQALPWGRDENRGFTANYPVPVTAVEAQDGSSKVPARKLDWFVPHEEYIRTRMMIPYLFLDLMTSLVGSVNSDVMWGRAVGTIKFDNWSTHREPQSDGTIAQEVTLQFTWRPYDWNADQADDGLNWIVFWDATTHAYRYPYADLTQLFTP